ncbi:MAG: YihY/virulence factor BrkB family protein [Lachnospiraceae bacterium]|nr:YihY/virulence factor BrkB family protein [Lachnospiraceae bacterium]
MKLKKLFFGIYKIGKTFATRMRANHVDVYAASAAFYMFICAVPFVLTLFSIVPFMPLTESDVTEAVMHILPEPFYDFALLLISETYNRHITILSVSAVAAVWSAARGLMSIRRGFDEIFHILEPYNYVLIRLKSMLYTFLMIIIMSVEIMFGAFGQSMFGFIERYFPNWGFSDALVQLYTNIAFIVGAFIMVMLLYCFLPHKKQKFRAELPGAVVATVGWVGFSKLFSLFLSFYTDSFSMYGSLATIVILLLWIYAMMYIMFIGAQINSEIADILYIHRFSSSRAARKKREKKQAETEDLPAEAGGAPEEAETEKRSAKEEEHRMIEKIITMDDIKQHIHNQ